MKIDIDINTTERSLEIDPHLHGQLTFYKAAKVIRKRVFALNGAATIGYSHGKIQPLP